MKRVLYAVVILLVMPLAAVAQESEDGGGFLTRTIEGLLSGAGREVRLEGFAGALSSEASFERLTIADDQGVWLTVEDVTLVWSRLSLLRGQLQVDRLTARSIDLPRLSQAPAEETVDIPDAEAKPFALPELPVSVNIDEVSIEKVTIGEPVIGVAAELALKASAQLDDDAARLDLLAERLDGQTGRFGIIAGFVRDTSEITVDVDLTEDAGGLVAGLMNLPGRPSVDLKVAGAGPIDDFTADIAMATDGQDRLTGQVSLRGQPIVAEEDQPDRRILATLSGDLTSLIAPEYRDFFGPDVGLSLAALQRAGGGLDVSDFELTSLAANVSGALRLNSDYWPSFIALDGAIRSASGAPVLLPGSNAGVSVGEVTLQVDFDAALGESLQGGLYITGLEHPQARIAQARLDLDGTLRGAAGTVGQLLTDITLTAEGLELNDPGLASAVGQALSASAALTYIEGQPIRIEDLAVDGADYRLAGEVVVQGLEAGFPTRLDLTVNSDDLSRFAGLSGQSLEGAAALGVAGSLTPLSGMFNLQIDGTTDDLAVGIPRADAVLAGRTSLAVQVQRDETGSFLRGLALRNDALDVTADAELKSEGSNATASARLQDLALVLPGRSGPVTLEAAATQEAQGWRVDAEARAPYDISLLVAGLATGPDTDLQVNVRVPDIEPLAPGVTGALTATGRLWQTDEGARVDFTADGPYAARVDVEGLATGPDMSVDFDLVLPDLNPIVPAIEGGVSAQGRVWQGATGYEIDARADGPYALEAAVSGIATGLDAALTFTLSLPDVQPLVPTVSGSLVAQGRVWQTDKGYEVDVAADGPYALRASVAGLATGADAALRFDVNLPDVAPLAPTVSGPLAARGVLRQANTGYEIDVTADGPYAATAAVSGLATGPQAALDFSVALPDLQPLVPSVSGPLDARGRLWQTPEGYEVDVTARGPQSAEATVKGLAIAEAMDLTYVLAVPRVQAFVPAVPGALQSSGRLWQTEQGYNVDVTADGPYAAKVAVEGLATGPDAAVTFSASVPNIALVVPGINGPLSVAGDARRAVDSWQLDTRLAGPSNAGASARGAVKDDGTLDLAIEGLVPLGLSAPFLAPRSLTGRADFDLAVQGAPALSSVSGRISTSGASFTAPNLRLAVTGIDTSVNLSGARADLTMRGDVSTGGQLSVDGGVGLDGDLPADLQIALRDVILTDPRLYSTVINGDLGIDGPLAGGAQISGTINVGETLVTVPAGLVGIGEIPDISHEGAPSRVTLTRERAGVIPQPKSEASASGGAAFGLDIAVNAPSRLFVRGRGLDAELGGSLTLTGSTAQVISAGRFELLRGRIDILAKRFQLDEGIAEFQGDFIPYLRFVTTSTTRNGTASVILEGPADDPEITFESTPAAPQDEVLAQLLFGADLSDISAFQAVQLANAVAVLSGGKSIGLVSNLREGFGLDDFDITTTDSGETAVRAGKYISEDIYTDITAAGNGQSEISLNFDLTDSLKAKGTVQSDGTTGLGIFFERDY